MVSNACWMGWFILLVFHNGMLDSDDDSAGEEPSLKINTLSSGYTMCFDSPMTKGEFIAVCEDIENNTGPGTRWEPLRNGMGLRMASWPGKKDDGDGVKEMRVTGKARAKCARTQMERVVWPVVEENARELWREDPGPCVRKGRYKTEFVSFGNAPPWRRTETDMIRDALLKRGVKVTSSTRVRQLRYRRKM